ncbi:PREDICTED: uncharacterized protein LOC107161863 [Diuraphis noxia]|uniref:uncharacterized protein LOC107161863 n=1 Tax=Diuraphis noxia TaxID=143948 RepID=UPI000763B926|nr:PREDICTED: uncharacterized protein LOC107161863 [Diuraphis noxia]
MINEQISERRTCLSTFRDMYLEVMECLNELNTSIFGFPVIIACIASNVAEIINAVYRNILFARDYEQGPQPAFAFIRILIKTINILTLYIIGHSTEKEINRMSLVLYQRSLTETNQRIKRQIKFFLLRRLHEHYKFKLYGICHINLRQLLILTNKAIGYLLIQILFQLNK